MILRMDWLTANHAIVDCFCKLVTFAPRDQPPFQFYGAEGKPVLKLIFALPAWCLLKQGYTGFLASLIGYGQQKLMLEDVPAVKEYFDVFPDDLLRLAPDGEVEIIIDLVSGTT